MSDIQEKSAKNGALNFIANGGGAVTFRLLTSAMGALLIVLVGWGMSWVGGRFDKLDGEFDAVNKANAATSARVDVHANRLDHLDASDLSLWNAVHSNGVRIDDHEHRISLIEGAHSPPR